MLLRRQWSPEDVVEHMPECQLCQSVHTIGTHRHTKSCKRRRRK